MNEVLGNSDNQKLTLSHAELVEYENMFPIQQDLTYDLTTDLNANLFFLGRVTDQHDALVDLLSYSGVFGAEFTSIMLADSDIRSVAHADSRVQIAAFSLFFSHVLQVTSKPENIEELDFVIRHVFLDSERWFNGFRTVIIKFMTEYNLFSEYVKIYRSL